MALNPLMLDDAYSNSALVITPKLNLRHGVDSDWVSWYVEFYFFSLHLSRATRSVHNLLSR